MVLPYVLTLFIGCSGGAKESDEAGDTSLGWGDLPAQPNVLFVLTDTMRADHLSPYGYHRDTTPWFKEFSEEAVLFEQANSQNAWTPPSVSSIFTGLTARAHGVTTLHDAANEGSNLLLDGYSTLAELFQEAGYRTGAMVKSPVPREETGFGQGFDSFVTVEGLVDYDTSGEELVASAISWLDTVALGSESFFLYLHFMEPHTAYIAPIPYRDLFDEGWDSELTGTHAEVSDIRAGKIVATADDREHLIALYDGELAYWDHQVSTLVSHVESLGILEETIVVFVGDHGEQFNEHGDWLHGALYQENIHVPMVLRIPGLSGRRIAGQVQVMDITPTLAGLCGLSTVDVWQARDLRPSILQGEVQNGAAFSQYGTERALVNHEGMKLLFEDGAAKLFDLKADPMELANLADQSEYAEVLSQLQSEIDDIFQVSEGIRNSIEP
jgi:arylsulfatase A-like enzyme